MDNLVNLDNKSLMTLFGEGPKASGNWLVIRKVVE